jgi:hypothetical protein
VDHIESVTPLDEHFSSERGKRLEDYLHFIDCEEQG